MAFQNWRNYNQFDQYWQQNKTNCYCIKLGFVIKWVHKNWPPIFYRLHNLAILLVKTRLYNCNYGLAFIAHNMLSFRSVFLSYQRHLCIPYTPTHEPHQGVGLQFCSPLLASAAAWLFPANNKVIIRIIRSRKHLLVLFHVQNDCCSV